MPTTTTSNTTSHDQYIKIKDYDEYLSFIQNIDDAEIAKIFVCYDTISHFGAFSYFHWYGDGTYSYTLEDSAGYYMSLNIHSHNVSFGTSFSEAEVNPADMRSIDTLGGCYVIDGIRYSYYGYSQQAKLMSIQWKDNKHAYSLASVHFDKHPLDDSVLGQLLNIEDKTAEELWALINGDQ